MNLLKQSELDCKGGLQCPSLGDFCGLMIVFTCRLLEEASHTMQLQSEHSSEAETEAVVAQMRAFALSEGRISLLDNLAQHSARETENVNDVWLRPFTPMPVASLLPKARVFSYHSKPYPDILLQLQLEALQPEVSSCQIAFCLLSRLL